MLGYRRRAVEEALATHEQALAANAEALAARDRALAASAAVLAYGRDELERREVRITELDLVCDSLCMRIVERERELERIRLDLERARAGQEGAAAALAEIEEELDGLRRQARGQATRIRLGALREAAELSRRITELTRRPAESRERLLESVNEAIARIGAEPADFAAADLDADHPAESAEPALAEPAEPAELASTDPDKPADLASRDPEPAPAPTSSNGAGAEIASGLFDGLVEVEVGPLADFSQLVGFEDAAGGITATSQISVKRFTQGRATLEVRLTEPVELLRELEERSPFEFRVRDQRTGRVVLDVDDE